MKSIKGFFKIGAALIVALTLLQPAAAQALLDSLSQDDHEIVSSIAPYTPEMRAAILDVSQYPQVLVKLERIQARTSQSFQDLIASYPREEQEKFYQASRFPDLTDKLATLGSGHDSKAKSIVKDYPEGAQQPVLDVYTNHFDDLVKINSIYQSSQKTMDELIAPYSPQVREDFNKVVANPDVMSLLTDNINLTVSLGEDYKANPKGVEQYLDSLHTQIDQQNAKDLADYKQAIESDPKLQSEMKSAADDYARQYDQSGNNPAAMDSNYYGSAPYPYWFGYPYWYGSPMWYPSPLYYQTGFYYGPGGGLVVVGLPSFYYANWFFARGYRHYPVLYRHYNTYYNLHRVSITHVNVYRGFNSAARYHFNPGYRGRSYYNDRGGYRGGAYHGPRPVTGGRNRPTGNVSPGRVAPAHQPIRAGGFNNNHFNHYNANSFHSMGWQHVNGGGMHSSAGFSGGNMHGGGGMHGRR